MKRILSFALVACTVAWRLPVAAQGLFAPESVRRASAEVGDLTKGPVQSAADIAWQGVTRLATGQEVCAVLDDGTSQRGRFRAADGVSLTVAVDGRDQRLERARVLRVTVVRGMSRKRNVWIGIAAGTVASLVAVGLKCRGASSGCNEVAPVYWFPLAGAGALIGALAPPVRTWTEVYAAPANR